MSSDQVEELDAPILESEVIAGIQCMKPRKSPGLNSFPEEYYKKKTHTYTLAPILTEVYSESISQGKSPNTFNEALI